MDNKGKKKQILLFSSVFPPSHSKAGQPTGFADKLDSGSKIHTIRADSKGWWVRGERGINNGEKILAMRQWSGRPYNSPQVSIGERERIGLQSIIMTYGSEDELPKAWVDGKPVPVELLAKNDGLSVEDFVEWFFGTKLYSGNVFEGVVIQLTDFRY